jgi:hypothetical protein
MASPWEAREEAFESIHKGGSNMTTKAHFTLGVRADVQPKSSITIGAKVEISPKGFTLGVKAEIDKIFSICPQATNKC